MNTKRHWQRQLKRIEGSIAQFEAIQDDKPILDPDGLRITHEHLYSIRNGLRRELGMAPTAAERRSQL